MRTLDEIRNEMLSVAQDYKAAEAAGIEEAMGRLKSWYDALAWTLQEPWKPEG